MGRRTLRSHVCQALFGRDVRLLVSIILCALGECEAAEIICQAAMVGLADRLGFRLRRVIQEVRKQSQLFFVLDSLSFFMKPSF